MSPCPSLPILEPEKEYDIWQVNQFQCSDDIDRTISLKDMIDGRFAPNADNEK